jgi:hypothetical protein
VVSSLLGALGDPKTGSPWLSLHSRARFQVRISRRRPKYALVLEHIPLGGSFKHSTQHPWRLRLRSPPRTTVLETRKHTARWFRLHPLPGLACFSPDCQSKLSTPSGSPCRGLGTPRLTAVLASFSGLAPLDSGASLAGCVPRSCSDRSKLLRCGTWRGPKATAFSRALA